MVASVLMLYSVIVASVYINSKYISSKEVTTILKNTAKVMGVNGGVGFASGALYEAMDVIEEDGLAGLADADNVKQILKSGATEGATSAAFSGATYMAGQAVKNLCFTEGTLVSTAEGLVAIECITAGMLVYAYSEETGRTELKEVVQTFENETSELVHISVNGEEIEATPSHPFYSPVKGWTEAVDLRAGDILVLRGDEYVIVEQVQHEILENPVKVYNFEVEDYHTYFVGESEVLVHNMCTSEVGGKNTIEVNGKTVTMDNSTFDPNFVDSQGRTNIQRMEQGLSPIGIDGKSVNIHHIDQTNDGPVIEITATEHQQNYSSLHTNTGQSPSQINRSEFNNWRNEYWKWRSDNLD